MKRHPSLVPLSRDHHDTLVVAQGLIRGRSTAPRSDWPTDRRAQVTRVIAFFAQTLKPHFETEEAVLFPTAARWLPDDADLIRALRDEHDRVRSVIRNLERDPTTHLDTRLPALGRLLDAHIRKEERVLFQALQREMSATELERIGVRLERCLGRDASCGVTNGHRSAPALRRP